MSHRVGGAVFGCLLALLLCVCVSGKWPLGSESSVSDKNGGSDCVVCTLLIAIIAQIAQVYNETPKQAFEQFCGYFNTDEEKIVYDACVGLKDTIGDAADVLLREGNNPDDVCFKLHFCNDNDGAMCRLYPAPTTVTHPLVGVGEPTKLCNITGVRALCDLLERWGDDHLPVDDVDGDWFSAVPEMRGTNWRGKDCNDIDGAMYPGRKATIGDRDVDGNCNGIWGVDAETGKSYEQLWCDGTGQIGVAVLGDSAGAHFHIPMQWMNVSAMSANGWAHTTQILLDELDWPMYSATTAFYNSTLKYEYNIEGPVTSLYQIMRQRNRCMHRDYQNLGVNGARSSSMASSLVQTLRRNALKDNPLFVLYELMGNDVCNGHPNFDHMTTPAAFYDNNLKAFQYLDSILPYGSHVLAMGLANGTALYAAMHNQIHPIGWVNRDVTYKAVYDYLNCLEVSPCWGWMNSNATVRQLTQERADALSAALYNLTVTESFANLTLHYIQCPINGVINEWRKQGGKSYELIEPCDGFHPNQLANALMAQYIWNELGTNFTAFMNPINPHNDEIIAKFGDQNGY